ncbi:MAG: HAD family hydrolase [Verrucomicrobiota bacterium]|nr:HAD family hydrolase [Verrucomicrobiota bacterium]
MSLPVKLLSTDFDGTLHTEYEVPPIPADLERIIGALQRHGVKWVINTGRDLSSLLETLARSQVKIRPDYVIVVEREIYQLNQSEYVGLQEWNDACTQAHKLLFARIRSDMPKLLEWVRSNYEATIYEDTYSPFCLIARNTEDAEAIHQYLAEYCSRIGDLSVMRNDIYARFSHVAYNKGTALTEVARRLGIKPKEIIVAGDHFNDIPMLDKNVAEWLISPGNAISFVKESVKSQGGYVSHQLFGSGVARGLEYVLERCGCLERVASAT